MAFARARVASSSAHLSWTSCACVAARKGGRRRARGCRDRGLQHGPIGRSIATVEVAVEAVDIDRMARARRRLRRRLRPRLLSARGSVDWFTARAIDRRAARARGRVAGGRPRGVRDGVRGVSGRLGTRAVGARVRARVGRVHVPVCRHAWTFGVFEVRARARVSLERGDVR